MGRIIKHFSEPYFQICLCTGSDFVSDRYCLRGEGEGGGGDVNRIQLDTATAALWEPFQQRFIQDVLLTDFTASDEHLQSIT